MKRIIHNIRQKPDHHKDRIIWLTMAVAIAGLLLTWAIVGNGRETAPDETFFQNFSRDLEEGRKVVPEDPLAP